MASKGDASSAVTAGELAAVLQAMDDRYRPLLDAEEQKLRSRKKYIHCRCLL